MSPEPSEKRYPCPLPLTPGQAGLVQADTHPEHPAHPGSSMKSESSQPQPLCHPSSLEAPYLPSLSTSPSALRLPQATPSPVASLTAGAAFPWAAAPSSPQVQVQVTAWLLLLPALPPSALQSLLGEEAPAPHLLPRCRGHPPGAALCSPRPLLPSGPTALVLHLPAAASQTLSSSSERAACACPTPITVFSKLPCSAAHSLPVHRDLRQLCPGPAGSALQLSIHCQAPRPPCPWLLILPFPAWAPGAPSEPRSTLLSLAPSALQPHTPAQPVG